MKTPQLIEVLNFLPWQWHRDGVYLAGFRTKEAAEQYGKTMGWIQEETREQIRRELDKSWEEYKAEKKDE